MYEVLKACLVDGYGSKAAAGWSVVYDDYAATGNFSLTNGPQSGVLGLYHAKTTALRSYEPVLFVAEGMSSAAVPVLGRSLSTTITNTAALSYTYSTTLHGAGGYKSSSNYSPRWLVIANDSWCWVVVVGNASYHGYFNGNPPRVSAWDQWLHKAIGFGAINSPVATLGAGPQAVAGNFCIVGGYSSVGLGYPDWLTSPAPFTGLRSDLGTSQALAARYAVVTPFISATQACQAAYESQLLPAMLYVSESSTSYLVNTRQLGRLPGLMGYRDMSVFNDDALAAKYHPGGVSFRDVMTVDGRNVLYGVIAKTPIFLSLDAADW
ncbi:hypothetical protein [Parathalassolituus penaei]|uniref:Uncharacterized protein n=1 Tax=Parathalassolituus penaei TaxID=2997323 RepID=A0A9X3ITB2_9GAMM|nr:hypothetical protein [Parathalassolituus penaei]MCY0966125.1 hypothetical protein [Parathalassolituus penaei]